MFADHIAMSKFRDMVGKSERIVVDVSLADLPRLVGLLYPDDTVAKRQIRMQFEFRRGTQRLPEIIGSASGVINLRCQRCLGLLEWPVELGFSLVVAENAAEFEKSSAPFDTVLAPDGGISLLELAEDELFASLPLAPMHDDPAICRSGVHDAEDARLRSAEVGDVHVAEPMPAANTTRPFAGLAALMTEKASSGNGNKS